MKLEHTVKIAHFKNSTNPRRRNHYTQVAIEEPGSLERAHDHPESERVDEVDSAEVQHQTMTAFTHLGHHMLAQFRSAYNVKLPATEVTHHGPSRNVRVNCTPETVSDQHALPVHALLVHTLLVHALPQGRGHNSRYMVATDVILGSLSMAPTTETSVCIT